jgi:hypothetical protein
MTNRQPSSMHPPASTGPKNEDDARPSARTAARRQVLAAVAASPLIAALGARAGADARTPTGPGAEDSSCDTSLEAKRKEAKVHLENLQTLNSRHPALVPDATVTSVQEKVDAGDSSVTVGEHATGCQYFVTAIEEATEALRTYYPRASEDYLATVEKLLADARDRDHPALDSDIYAIETRKKRVRDRLKAADSLADYREAYNEARRLRRNAEDRLEPTPLEIAATRASLAGPVAVIATVAAVAEAYLLVRNEDEESPRFDGSK